MQSEKEYLKKQQYQTSVIYENRMKLLDYSDPKINHWEWLAKWHDLAKAKNILEVGCGPGILWRYLDAKQFNAQQQIMLTDFSAGMLEAAKTNISHLNLPSQVAYAEADVEALQFANEYFDTVLAHLMIYHANSPETALQEIKRVTKVAGHVYISTMAAYSNNMVLQIAHAIDQRIPPYSFIKNFSEEVADNLLPHYFSKINKQAFETTIKFTDATVIVEYLKGYPPVQKLNLGEEFFVEYQRRAEQLLTENGVIATPFRIVLFHCIK